MAKEFARRSFLYTPGSSLKMITKAMDTRADSIILDLEDGVDISEKDSARENVIKVIADIKARGKEIIVRVNALDTLHGLKDFIAVTGAGPHAFIIPMADEVAIRAADMILKGLENDLGIEVGTIRLIPLLETTAGILNAHRILASSARINGVQLGAEDLTNEQEIERTKQGDEIRYARQVIAFAGCAEQIDIIDTPFTDIKDIEGLKKDAYIAKSIGFTGKTCIHPAHIETINQVFSPDVTAISQAKRIVEAFAFASAEGKGCCMFEGKLLDRPIVERARKIIAKADLTENH